MNFGLIPLAAQFVVSVASWMVKSRVSAATAAQYAAAEFDYIKRASDAELTEIAFEMAKQFPEYPYWEWFRIMQDLRKYGAFEPGPKQAPSQPPAPGEKPPDEKKDNTVWIWAAAGVVVLVLLTR